MKASDSPRRAEATRRSRVLWFSMLTFCCRVVSRCGFLFLKVFGIDWGGFFFLAKDGRVEMKGSVASSTRVRFCERNVRELS